MDPAPVHELRNTPDRRHFSTGLSCDATTDEAQVERHNPRILTIATTPSSPSVAITPPRTLLAADTPASPTHVLTCSTRALSQIATLTRAAKAFFPLGSDRARSCYRVARKLPARMQSAEASGCERGYRISQASLLSACGKACVALSARVLLSFTSPQQGRPHLRTTIRLVWVVTMRTSR